jgi:phosphoribosylanthranilate isomerase
MSLKWKVCGMRYAENIQQVLELEPDYMGFIFYNMSPRYVGDLWDGPGEEFPATTKKVGVFVNESSKRIRALAERYQLDHLQLHGHETPQYCQELFENGYTLIKVMSLKVEEDLDNLKNYKRWVKYFLFDTPSKQFGGTGNTFDWSLLEQYHNEVPIFLSGGISLDNLSNVKKLKELNLEAIDVNSRFEIRPGWKDPAMLERLKNQIQEL